MENHLILQYGLASLLVLLSAVGLSFLKASLLRLSARLSAQHLRRRGL